MANNYDINCTAGELAEKLENNHKFLLLDVRTINELQLAVIQPCIHIPVHELQERLHILEEWRNEEIICLCHHGIRSAAARNYLESEGFMHVRNLVGGIDAYSIEVDSSIPRYN